MHQKRLLVSIAFTLALVACAPRRGNLPAVGQPIPVFSAKDLNGRLLRLICCVCLAAFLAGTDIRFSMPAAEAAASPRNHSYLDAQSRSGPTPPPGVLAAEHPAASAAALVIPGVPAYLWRYGCGPTAAGMLLGYWDAHGFPGLIPGDASTQTDAVNAAIANDGPASNYSDYCLPLDDSHIDPNPLPDKSEYPFGDEHPDNCLADWMKTSQSHSQNYYGWSWFSDVGIALERYVQFAQAGYHADVGLLTFYASDLSWGAFCSEIDAQCPVVLLVDTDGNGGTDHFVTAVGHDTVDGVQRYACLDTWDTDVQWLDFAPIAEGQPWGIFGAITLQLGGSSALLRIEPATRTVDAGTAFTTSVAIANAADLGGFQFTLDYDANTVRVESVALGSFPGSSGRAFTALGPTVDNVRGHVTFGAYSAGPTPAGSNGAGSLAVITWRAIGRGTTPLGFSTVQVANTGGQAQTATSSDGSVTVTGSAQTRFVYLPIIVRQ